MTRREQLWWLMQTTTRGGMRYDWRKPKSPRTYFRFWQVFAGLRVG